MLRYYMFTAFTSAYLHLQNLSTTHLHLHINTNLHLESTDLINKYALLCILLTLPGKAKPKVQVGKGQLPFDKAQQGRKPDFSGFPVILILTGKRESPDSVPLSYLSISIAEFFLNVHNLYF